MKSTSTLIILVFAICTSNDLPAQVLNTTEISLIPHHTQHDVPNALRGVNQTANSNINWTYNTEFLDEFTAINPRNDGIPRGTFANSYDWELALVLIDIYTTSFASYMVYILIKQKLSVC
jgi:hypothetical protein